MESLAIAMVHEGSVFGSILDFYKAYGAHIIVIIFDLCAVALQRHALQRGLTT